MMFYEPENVVLSKPLKITFDTQLKTILSAWKELCCQQIQYLQVLFLIFLNKEWLFRHIHFCYGDRESQYGRNKLPKYCSNVANDVKQSNLNDADPFNCLHYVSKGPEGEEHGIEAVQITSDDKCSVIGHRCRQGPRDHSKQKREDINHQGDEIQNIPSVTERHFNKSKWIRHSC